MINKLDNTRFEVNLLDLYRENAKAFIITKLLEYAISDYNQDKTQIFDFLFLTPSNLASDFYKSDFFITTMIIDGVHARGKQDIEGLEYTDVTDVDNQIHFLFEESL